mgnify:CR=1 FL=1
MGWARFRLPSGDPPLPASVRLVLYRCLAKEPRERYVERWIANAASRYRALQAAEQALLFDHVRARDYPLSLDAWRAQPSWRISVER